MSALRSLLASALVLGLLAITPAQANDIVEVRSQSGVTAWLKQETSIPIIAVNALWLRAGAVTETADKSGRANLLSTMLDEGAGDLDSQAFQQRLDDYAIRLGFDTGRDSFSMSLQTLTENADEAFRMAGLALTQPRFEADALQRLKAALASQISRESRNPNSISGQAWSRAAFGADRYAQPVNGTPETLGALGADDLHGHLRDFLARDNLIIGVVGDISPERLKGLLDRAFGRLSPTAAHLVLGTAQPATTGSLQVIDYAGPQSVITFGLPGILRDDPDYDTARVMNHMLGGGGFGSLLTSEIREKRGLTYGVYSYLRPMARAGLWLGGLSTSNEKAAEALTVLRETIAAYRENGPTEVRLERAKANINGAFPLRFTSNSAIARLLVAMQRYDLGQDYMAERPRRISAVTVADVKRVANRLLDVDKLVIVAVGQPEGVTGD